MGGDSPSPAGECRQPGDNQETSSGLGGRRGLLHPPYQKVKPMFPFNSSPPALPREMLKELPLPGSARRPADGSDNTSGTAGQKADYPLSPCPKHPFNFTKPAAGKAPLILRIFCKLPDLQPAQLRPSPEGPRRHFQWGIRPGRVLSVFSPLDRSANRTGCKEPAHLFASLHLTENPYGNRHVSLL